jgi:hypothetical protein
LKLIHKDKDIQIHQYFNFLLHKNVGFMLNFLIIPINMFKRWFVKVQYKKVSLKDIHITYKNIKTTGED